MTTSTTEKRALKIEIELEIEKELKEPPATPGDSPAPLGDQPSEDQIIDVALECTFPASDPIAVECATHVAERDQREEEVKREAQSCPRPSSK